MKFTTDSARDLSRRLEGATIQLGKLASEFETLSHELEQIEISLAGLALDQMPPEIVQNTARDFLQTVLDDNERRYLEQISGIALPEGCTRLQALECRYRTQTQTGERQ